MTGKQVTTTVSLQPTQNLLTYLNLKRIPSNEHVSKTLHGGQGCSLDTS